VDDVDCILSLLVVWVFPIVERLDSALQHDSVYVDGFAMKGAVGAANLKLASCTDPLCRIERHRQKADGLMRHAANRISDQATGCGAMSWDGCTRPAVNQPWIRRRDPKRHTTHPQTSEGQGVQAGIA
jgi:hypothetical protein